MAGTLTISTLSDGTNSTSSTNCIRGTAMAWVNWNGVTTPVIRSSYNVSSITRNSTGVYLINLTNAMADTNYLSITGGSPALSGNSTNTYNMYSYAYSTTQVYAEFNNNSTQVDYANCNTVVHR
jgi:hypothetical protein